MDREQTQQLMVDFYNGLTMLHEFAAWAYVEANRSLVIEQVASFAEAYEALVQLHAAGKAGAGDADFSLENLDRVKQLVALIRAGLDTDEARGARGDLHALAERCLRGLLVQQGGPPSPEKP